jgi:alanine racemase
MEPLIVPRAAFPDVRLGETVTIFGKKYTVASINGASCTENLEIIPDSQLVWLDPA